MHAARRHHVVDSSPPSGSRVDGRWIEQNDIEELVDPDDRPLSLAALLEATDAHGRVDAVSRRAHSIRAIR